MANIVETLSSKLEQVNSIDTYSESYMNLLLGIEEEFNDLGLVGSEDIVEFYTSSIFLARYGYLNLENSKGKDFKFGFKEFGIILEAVNEYKREDLDINLATQLKISKLRSVSLFDEESKVESLLAEDIALVRRSLGEDVQDADISEELKEDLSDGVSQDTKKKVEQLQKSSKLKSIVSNLVSDILAVYDEAIQPGYELERYEAVITPSDVTPTMLVAKANTKDANGNPVESFNLTTMFSTASIYLSKAVTKAFSNQVKFNESLKQSDLMEIYTTEDATVTFPRKIVEFALGYGVSTVGEEPRYSRIPKLVWNSSKKEGTSNYGHRDAIKKYLEAEAWKYAVIVTDQLNLWEQRGIDTSNPAPMTPEVAEVYNSNFQRFKNSYCTFAILKKHTGEEEDWASAEWVISAPANAYIGEPLTQGSDFYKNVFSASGTIEQPRVSNIKGIVVKTYTHIANPAVAEAEPLFAYKAAEALNERGEVLNSKNILIGKGLDGKIITSSRSGNSRISLWQNLVHATNSGSRSGKGVQISSQLVPALVDSRPLFPQDRKPDTSVSLYIISGGADSKGTPYGYFIQGGAFSKGNVSAPDEIANELDWDNNPKIMSRMPRLVPKFWGISSYKGVWGDMAYFRSILLTLGILALRSQVRSSDPQLYEELGGDDGIVILYDEITAFINSFMQTYMNSSNWFSKDVWSKKKANALKVAMASSETAKEGSKALIEAEDTINEAKKDNFKFNVYMRDLVDNYNRSLDLLKVLEIAGFKGQESIFSDIYIVGQTLDITTPETRTIPFTNSGEVRAFSPKDNHLFAFLYNFQSDFIFGYNETSGASQQGWRKVQGSDSAKYLTETARRFGYLSGVTYEQVRDGSDKDANMAKAVDSADETGTVYFKPYLLLNASDGEPVRQLEQNLGDKADTIRANNSQDGDSSKWDKRIGFLDYVNSQMISGGDPGKSLKKARAIAEKVIAKMGYQGDYLDFLLDLRPEWNFSVADVVDAFEVPQKYAENERFSSWTQYNNILNGVDESESTNTDFETDSELAFNGGMNEFGLNGFDEVDADELEENPSNEFGLDNLNDEDYEGKHNTDASGFESTEEVPWEEDITSEYDPDSVVYENIQPETNVKGVTVPLSEDGLDRLAHAFGVSKEDVASIYSNRQPDEDFKQNLNDFNNAESFTRVNNTNMTFGDLMNGQSDALQGLQEAMEFITNDVFDAFEGQHNIHTIEVKAGFLRVNDIKYKPSFPNIQAVGLPIDKQKQFEDKEYAEFFDFRSLTAMSNISYLKLDSVQFALLRVSRPLGLDEDDSVFKLFDVFPTLREIQIGHNVFNRDDGLEYVIEQESLFKSSRRRNQVLNNLDKNSRNFRRARWDSTKRYWHNETGWRRFTGVTSNFVGASLGGVSQAGAKTASATNKLVNSASRLFSVISKDLKNEFSNKKK